MLHVGFRKRKRHAFRYINTPLKKKNMLFANFVKGLCKGLFASMLAFLMRLTEI